MMLGPSMADLYPMHDVIWMGPYRILEADDGCHHHIVWPAWSLRAEHTQSMACRPTQQQAHASKIYHTAAQQHSRLSAI